MSLPLATSFLQDSDVIELTANDLQPDRQPVGVETGADGACGVAGEVKY